MPISRVAKIAQAFSQTMIWPAASFCISSGFAMDLFGFCGCHFSPEHSVLVKAAKRHQQI